MLYRFEAVCSTTGKANSPRDSLLPHEFAARNMGQIGRRGPIRRRFRALNFAFWTPTASANSATGLARSNRINSAKMSFTFRAKISNSARSAKQLQGVRAQVKIQPSAQSERDASYRITKLRCPSQSRSNKEIRAALGSVLRGKLLSLNFPTPRRCQCKPMCPFVSGLLEIYLDLVLATKECARRGPWQAFGAGGPIVMNFFRFEE